ncbi:MAG: RsmB/NOP family class I SAM-dependent RNA methyltransferase [Pseudomonadota bacterium]
MTDPARRAALAALDGVLRRRRSLDEAVDGPLADSDRAFARRLAAATLRRLGQVDALVSACLSGKPPPGAVTDVLRLGAAQLLFMGVAPHAAVDTSVELVRAAGFPGHAKLVNALLRRLGREGAAMVAAQDAAQDAERLNTPAWLWESWSEAYGEETARSIAAAHLAEPPLDITAKDPAAWAGPLEARLMPTGSLRRAAGVQVSALPGHDDGAWWVQDMAAALPARLLGDVAGKRVADLCAAPGGKTAQLAAAGARVTALDRSEPRTRRLRANLARLGLETEVVVADAARWRPEAPFDAILLDAPCSATGTLRRHPDAAWLKRPEDVIKLAGVQDALLDAAADMLAPGGVLVYCVCSLQPEEGPGRIAGFLGRAPVCLDPIRPAEVGGLAELVTPEGFLRTLPCALAADGGMDGFFAARLIRT